MPQPYLVPVSPTFSLIAQSSGVSCSTSTSIVLPLIVRFAIAFHLLGSIQQLNLGTMLNLKQERFKSRKCVCEEDSRRRGRRKIIGSLVLRPRCSFNMAVMCCVGGSPAQPQMTLRPTRLEAIENLAADGARLDAPGTLHHGCPRLE